MLDALAIFQKEETGRCKSDDRSGRDCESDAFEAQGEEVGVDFTEEEVNDDSQSRRHELSEYESLCEVVATDQEAFSKAEGAWVNELGIDSD